MPAAAGFALALAGGVLLGGHSYLYDLAFSIPLLLTVLASPGIALWLKWAAGVFASPVVYLMPSGLAPPGLDPLSAAGLSGADERRSSAANGGRPGWLVPALPAEGIRYPVAAAVPNRKRATVSGCPFST